MINKKMQEIYFRSHQTHLDYMTEERIEELLKVVNESLDRMQDDFVIDKDNFRKKLKSDIDDYYFSRPLCKIKIIVDEKS